MKTFIQTTLCMLTIGLWLFAGLALAAPRALTNTERDYAACLLQAARDPLGGGKSAMAWHGQGGGTMALHCAAVALSNRGSYVLAAKMLERVARGLPEQGRPSRADALGQAANAWLLAGQTQRAAASIENALEQAPGDGQLLIDRARIRAEQKNYAGALADLDAAAKTHKWNAPLHAYRAAALRHLGKFDAALLASETALSLAPDLREALLEHGILLARQRKFKAAKADFKIILERYPGTPAGDLAAQLLKAIARAETQ